MRSCYTLFAVVLLVVNVFLITPHITSGLSESVDERTKICNGNPRCIIRAAAKYNDKTICNELNTDNLRGSCMDFVDNINNNEKSAGNSNPLSSLPLGTSVIIGIGLLIFVIAIAIILALKRR